MNRHHATYRRTMPYSHAWAVWCDDCPERCIAVLSSQSAAMVAAHAHNKRGYEVRHNGIRTKVVNALCADGGRRTAYVTADTARVFAHGKKISGVIASIRGEWRFLADRTAKNGGLLHGSEETATVTLYEDNAGHLALHKQGDEYAWLGLEYCGEGQFAVDAAALLTDETGDWILDRCPRDQIDQGWQPRADYDARGVALIDAGRYAGVAARSYLGLPHDG